MPTYRVSGSISYGFDYEVEADSTFQAEDRAVMRAFERAHAQDATRYEIEALDEVEDE